MATQAPRSAREMMEELNRMPESEIIFIASRIHEISDQLIEKYAEVCPMETRDLLQLSPLYHMLIGSTWRGIHALKTKERFRNIEDLNGIVSRIGSDIQSSLTTLLTELNSHQVLPVNTVSLR